MDRTKGQKSSGPNYAEFRMVDGAPLLSLTAHSSCLQHVINPHDPDGDYDRWVNGNGDYIADHNWAPDEDNPWVCNDYGPPPRTYTASLDNHGFVMSTATDFDGSFFLFAPDGKGIDIFSYNGRDSDLLDDYMNIVFQTGGAYDGIYCDYDISNCDGRGWCESHYIVGYIAHDSIKGNIIPAYVGIDELTPVVFTVKQNTPNPFNPATTIAFTLAESVVVAVDVYNSAGQKVTSLTDGRMDAGKHSVVWDASGFAAGIYFCTVQAGESARTIKMTLVK